MRGGYYKKYKTLEGNLVQPPSPILLSLKAKSGFICFTKLVLACVIFLYVSILH